MPQPATIKRLQKEYLDIKKSLNGTDCGMEMHPDPEDILRWWCVFTGQKDTPYEGGEYLVRLQHNNDYPMAPPSVMMLTPSGRFEPSKKVCTTHTEFHPEMWSPCLTTSKVLVGLFSFMADVEFAAGCVKTDDATKRAFAKSSHAFNITHPKFAALFPHKYAQAQERVAKMEAEKVAKK